MSDIMLNGQHTVPHIMPVTALLLSTLQARKYRHMPIRKPARGHTVSKEAGLLFLTHEQQIQCGLISRPLFLEIWIKPLISISPRLSKINVYFVIKKRKASAIVTPVASSLWVAGIPLGFSSSLQRKLIFCLQNPG